MKNDQCFVEEKNRTIVRQVVGYDRFVGEHALRQLEELYRALRLYVNCFQPSMKLVSKQRNGKKISYCYDSAKTPLQRLLLSGILPVETQQELNEVAQALDPIRLLEQLQRLQQALFHCATEANPFVSPAAVVPLRVFAVETCTTGGVPARESIPDLSGGLPTLYQQQEKRKRVLGWRRTQKDPFEGAWEQIASWVQANPERSSGDIFRELQRLSPGRYQPLQIRTLQRGMRKIRAFLLETPLEPWPEEVIQGQASDPVEPVQWTHEEGEEACSLCSRTLTTSLCSCPREHKRTPIPCSIKDEEKRLHRQRWRVLEISQSSCLMGNSLRHITRPASQRAAKNHTRDGVLSPLSKPSRTTWRIRNVISDTKKPWNGTRRPWGCSGTMC